MSRMSMLACGVAVAVLSAVCSEALGDPGDAFLDYVVATNNAAVDTGYVANGKTVIGFKGLYETKVANGSLFTDYTADASVATRVILYNTNEKSVYVTCYSVANSSIAFNNVATGLCCVITGLLNRAANKYVVNGVSTTVTKNTGTLTGKSVKLHASNCQTRLYYFTVSEGYATLHDFRPCVQDGEVGYLDLVTGEFHGKADENGTLTAGPVRTDMRFAAGDAVECFATVTNAADAAILSFDGGATWCAGTNGWFAYGTTISVRVHPDARATTRLTGPNVVVTGDGAYDVSVTEPGTVTTTARRDPFVWTGGGGKDTKWETPANWGLASGFPGDDDAVTIPVGATEGTAVTITLSTACRLRSLAITGGAGTLGFTVSKPLAIVSGGLTVPSGATLALDQPCAVTGDVTVAAGGRLAHSAQPAGTGTIADEKYKLNLTVSGSITVAAGGRVDVQGRGFNSGGPGSGTSNNAPEAGHGGQRGTSKCYGSAIHPVNFGTCCTSVGGGAIRLIAGGDCTVNGTVTANGGDRPAYHYSGSGGSVWITCATLRGSGEISSDGGGMTGGSHAGAGGRIALYQTAATDESAFTGALHARGGKSGAVVEAPPGTVYLVRAGEADTAGTLLVENDGGTAGTVELGSATDSSALGFLTNAPGTTVKILAGSTLTLRRGLGIGGTLTYGDAACGIVLTGTEAATVTGAIRVPSFVCEVPGKSITFGAGATDVLTVAANGTFRLVGADGNPVGVFGATSARGKVTLENGVRQWVAYADVRDMAAPGAEIIAYGSTGLRNDNWTISEFIEPGAVVAWTGAQGTSSWTDKRNWSPQRVPIETDVVSNSAAASVRPVLTSPVALGGLILPEGSHLTLDGGTVSLTGDLKADGALVACGRDRVTVAGNVTFGAHGSWSGDAGTLAVTPGGSVRTVDLGAASLGLLAVAGGAGTVRFVSDVTARRVTFDASEGEVTAAFADGCAVTCREFYGFGLAKDADGSLAGRLTLCGIDGGAWTLKATSAAVALGTTARHSDASGGVTVFADAAHSSVDGTDAGWDTNVTVAAWIGPADGAWGTAANWSTLAVPGADAVTVIREAASVTLPSPCSLKGLLLGGGAAAVNVTAGSTLAVGTFLAVGDLATFTANQPVTVTNDLVVADGGTMTHGTKDRSYRLDVAANGNAFVDGYGKLDAKAKSAGGGPGAASISSYGGRQNSGVNGWIGPLCYGSLAKPSDQGSVNSGGLKPAPGGVLKITAGGTLRFDGTADASAGDGNTHYQSTGGSVWFTAARIVGGGTVLANGGCLGGGSYGGSGGRIAFHQTDPAAADFSSFTGHVEAVGSRSNTGVVKQAPGTVYWREGDQAEDEGTLVVASPSTAWDTNLRVEIDSGMTDCAVGTTVISNYCLMIVAEGMTFTMKGGLLTAGRFVAAAGSSVIFAGTDDATIRGTNEFDAVSCTVPGKRLFFGTNRTDVVTVKATGAVTFQGSEENPVCLLPAAETASADPWRLSVADGAEKAFRYVAVSNCTAVGVPITAYDSIDLGGNTGWTFVTTPKPGAKLTWTGAVSADPSDVANWDPERERLETDDVTIPADCDRYPVFTAGNPRFNKLTVDAGGALTVAGTSLTVTNALTVNGTLTARGSERIASEGRVTFGGAAAFAAGTGTFVLAGGADQQVDPAGAAFYRLAVEKAAGTVTFADGFAANEFRVVAGTAARTLSFAAGSCVTCRVFAANGRFTGTSPGLTLTGSAQWELSVLQEAMAFDTAVRNSRATGAGAYAGGASENLGGNAGWTFGAHVSVWTGGASGAFATAANWADGIVPGPTSRVAIAGASVTAETLSLAALTLSDATLVASALNATGDVAAYGESTLSLSRPSAVTGSVFVGTGAALTHAAGNAANKLDLTAGGDVTIESGASVSAKARGTGGPGTSQISSHGGRMDYYSQYKWVGPLCYGSLTKPYDHGSVSVSGFNPAPGGVLKITAGGTLRLDGTADASAEDGNTHYQSTGGSIWFTAARIVGGGTVLANGGCLGTGSHGGSGGRIALCQTDPAATDFSSFTGHVEACGSRTSAGTIAQAPGTVYWRTGDQAEDEGTLVVANGDCAAGSNLRVQIDARMRDCAVGTVAVSNNCALVIGTNATLTVKGDFLNDGQFRCLEGGELLFAGTGVSRIRGSNVVSKLTCVTPGKRLRFGTTQGDYTGIASNGYFTVRGTEQAPVELEPDDDEGEWRIGGGTDLHQDVQCAGVRNSNASYGVPLAAVASVDRGNTVSGENVNWNISAPIVPGEKIVWTGNASENWADILNWDRRRLPVETDCVEIPAGCERYPAIAIADVTVNGLSVAGGARLTLSGHALTVTNVFAVAGTFTATGAETVRCEGDVSLTGSFTGEACTLVLAGDGNQAVNLNGAAYHELRVEKGGGALSFVAFGFSAETLRLTASGPLTVSVPNGRSVTCGDFYAEGGAKTNLTLCSDVSGKEWMFAKRGLGRVRGVRVRDSNALGGDIVYAEDPCEDLGGNANWTFGAKTATWTGEGAAGDFSDGANWSTGIAPDGETRAVLSPTGTLALTVSGGLALRELTVGGGGGAVTFTVNGPLCLGDALEMTAGGTATFNGLVTVSNRVVVRAGGTVTHGVCTTLQTNRLDMTVFGDVTVEAGGAITANGKGFTNRIGPGFSGQGNAHGGRIAGSSAACYGRIESPFAQGTGGDGYAGGVIRVTAGGTLRLDGTVSADGAAVLTGLAGTGGSVWLTAGTLCGAGTVSAKGGKSGTALAGGGGRIALVQTAAGDFSAWAGSETAAGGLGTGTKPVAGAGTVFRRASAADRGTVTVANAGGVGVTELPAAGAGDPLIRHRAWAFRVLEGGDLFVTRDVGIRDLALEDATAKVHLNGRTLTVSSREHKDGAGWAEGAEVMPGEGGQIVWHNLDGLLLIIR